MKPLPPGWSDSPRRSRIFLRPAALVRPHRSPKPPDHRCSDGGVDAGTGRCRIAHCVTAAGELRFPTVSIGGCGWLLPPAVSEAAVWQLRALCLLPPAASGSGCWDASTASERPAWVLTTVTQTPDTEWAGPVTPALQPSSRYAPSYRAQTARHAKFHSKKIKIKIKNRSTPAFDDLSRSSHVCLFCGSVSFLRVVSYKLRVEPIWPLTHARTHQYCLKTIIVTFFVCNATQRCETTATWRSSPLSRSEPAPPSHPAVPLVPSETGGRRSESRRSSSAASREGSPAQGSFAAQLRSFPGSSVRRISGAGSEKPGPETWKWHHQEVPDPNPGCVTSLQLFWNNEIKDASF